MFNLNYQVMKTLIASIFGLLLTSSSWANGYGNRPDYVYFQEKNVSFYLYRDGTFDFEVHHYERPRETRVFASISTPYLQINYQGGGRDYYGRSYVTYDGYGKIRRIGDIYINYDGYGQLNYIGSVRVNYYDGYVSSISHPRASYAHYKRYYRPYRQSYTPGYYRPAKQVHYQKRRGHHGYAYGRHHD